LAIKIQQLQSIASFAPKGKYRAARWFLAQDILCKGCQAFYSFALMWSST